MSEKIVNDSVGSNDLVLILLVYSTLPQLCLAHTCILYIFHGFPAILSLSSFLVNFHAPKSDTIEYKNIMFTIPEKSLYRHFDCKHSVFYPMVLSLFSIAQLLHITVTFWLRCSSSIFQSSRPFSMTWSIKILIFFGVLKELVFVVLITFFYS